MAKRDSSTRAPSSEAPSAQPRDYSNPAGQPAKSKPKADFPLRWHPLGGWCKKVLGKVYYFGKDQDRALREWIHAEPYLKSGRVPPPFGEDDYLTIENLCNLFLEHKEAMVESGELTKRSWNDYFRVCAQLRDYFGPRRSVEHLQPSDFAGLRQSMANRLSSCTVANRLTRMRVVFKWALDNELIPKLRYGQAFSRPKAKTLRLERAAKGPAIYSREEYLQLIATADTQFRAMLLLAMNAGMGPADIGLLRLSELNLADGWLRTVRHKTGIARAAWLWPETREALRSWISQRSERRLGPEVQELVFVTKYGHCWHKEDSHDTPISNEFAKLIRKTGIPARRHVGFYSLRRCVETFGGETGDQVAVDFVMGHCDQSMGAVYRQGVSDERVRRVCDAIRKWLFKTGD